MKTSALLTGIAATAFACAAFANEGGQKMSFETFDKDGNGTISAAEAAAHEAMASQLALLDSDGDGAISRDEFKRLRVAEGGKEQGDSGLESTSTDPAATDQSDTDASDTLREPPTR